MSTKHNPKIAYTGNAHRPIDQPTIYQLRVEGHLDQRWTEQFENMTVTLEEDGTTLLTGPLVDQAALHGLLKKIRDVGVPLLSVLASTESSATTS